MADAEVERRRRGDDRRPRRPLRGINRRCNDDPDLKAVFERALLDVGRALHALRERQGWSQEAEAIAAGLHRETVCELERCQGDPRLSTIVRLFYIHGFRFQVELRANPQPRIDGYNQPPV